MARYKMDDQTVVDTERASQSWDERTEFDGRNQISVVTHSQWEHERLHKSSKGRYFIERWSDRQGTRSAAEWVDAPGAARWLVLNGKELPTDLLPLADEVSE